MVCRERLARLLRYGRKNGGSWDDGECDHPENTCEMLDDDDVDRIIAGLDALQRVQSGEKVFRCVKCEAIYLDEPVSVCDCAADATEFRECRLVDPNTEVPS